MAKLKERQKPQKPALALCSMPGRAKDAKLFFERCNNVTNALY